MAIIHRETHLNSDVFIGIKHMYEKELNLLARLRKNRCKNQNFTQQTATLLRTL